MAKRTSGVAKLNWKFPTLEEFKEGIARARAKIEAFTEIGAEDGIEIDDEL